MMSPIDSSVLARDVETLLGADRVRRPRPNELPAARLIVEPASSAEVAQLVRKCEADKITVAPLGSARTLSNLRTVAVDLGVSLTKIDRIIAYEPDDMTIVAEAGLTLGRLNREIAAHGQRLPADPVHPDLTTIGSLIAAAKSGPFRLHDGTVRDLLIGIRFAGLPVRGVSGNLQALRSELGVEAIVFPGGRPAHAEIPGVRARIHEAGLDLCSVDISISTMNLAICTDS